MRVTIGNVTKIIPEEYWDVVCMMTEDQLDAPKKLRLSPRERMIMAEATWRLSENDYIREFLQDRIPECVVIEYNRNMDVRYVIRYEKIGNQIAQAVVPAWVRRAFPKELVKEENFNWIKT